ncbi:MAG TPA: glycosyltransferase [Planctomycetia bacterium]|nr:glycosyltransferase [Planctomycetia bacterium]
MRNLTAIPVYNEERTVGPVLERVLAAGQEVLVVDDGSTDGTPVVLGRHPRAVSVRHAKNRGYGASLQTAFTYAAQHGYDVVTTLDADGQHDPSLIPEFVAACAEADIVSGSRYLREFATDTPAPSDRRRINMLLTDQINALLGLNLTDSFCGFKSHRVDALKRLRLTEEGYAFPMEFWVQAACKSLRVIERAVPRIYLDPNRSFGETLDDADRRLAYYQLVLDKALATARRTTGCGLQTARSASDAP